MKVTIIGLLCRRDKRTNLRKGIRDLVTYLDTYNLEMTLTADGLSFEEIEAIQSMFNRGKIVSCELTER